MYKVVIVDDEPMVCRRLTEKVRWKEWNCEVCATGSNGLEGKELVERLQPDIVLTDVKMPGIDGLELAEYISKQYPKTLVIILSGYNEFDFVRAAMRSHVFDYLLKPIDPDELKRAMRKAVYHLKKSEELTTKTEVITKKINDVNPWVESGFLLNLLLNQDHEIKSVAEKMEQLGVVIHKCQVVVYDLPNVWEEREKYKSLYQFALHNILYEIYTKNNCGVNLIWIADKCVVLAKFDLSIPSDIAQARVQKAADEALEYMKTFFKAKVFAGIGRFVNKIDGLHHSYQSALFNLENQLFWSLDSSEAAPAVTQSVVRVDEELYKAINDGNEDDSLKRFDEVMECLRKSRNINLVYSVSLEMIVNISNMMNHWNMEMDLPNLNDLKAHPYFHELVSELRLMIQTACSSIDKKRKFMTSPLMNKIVIYLQEHFNDSDLSLQLIADEFHLSVSHLSRLFKKEIGVNFNDHLNLMRIEKAKALLHEKYWLTSQDIAYQVGFTDGKYFGQVFKKYCGVTPSEYKTNVKKKGNDELTADGFLLSKTIEK